VTTHQLLHVVLSFPFPFSLEATEQRGWVTHFLMNLVGIEKLTIWTKSSVLVVSSAVDFGHH
jgi:hypothetical protein